MGSSAYEKMVMSCYHQRNTWGSTKHSCGMLWQGWYHGAIRQQLFGRFKSPLAKQTNCNSAATCWCFQVSLASIHPPEIWKLSQFTNEGSLNRDWDAHISNSHGTYELYWIIFQIHWRYLIRPTDRFHPKKEETQQLAKHLERDHPTSISPDSSSKTQVDYGYPLVI